MEYYTARKKRTNHRILKHATVKLKDQYNGFLLLKSEVVLM